jgi:hypothetical protein
MKKPFLTLVLFCHLLFNSFSQDIIKTTKGKEVKCKITNSDSTNVYFSLNKNGNLLNSFLPKNQVQEIKYGNDSKNKHDTIKFENAHYFSFNSGFSKNVIKDDAMSPYIYSGSNVPVNLNYRYIGNKSRQNASVYFDNVKLNTSATSAARPVKNLNALIEYSYNRLFYSVPKYRVQFFIGGKFKSLLNLRQFDFLSGNNSLIFEQINSLDINFNIEKQFLTKNDFISFNLNLPVIAYSVWNNIYNPGDKIYDLVCKNDDNIVVNGNQSKGKYFITAFKNGEFITLNKFFEVQAELCYTKFVSKRIGLNLKYVMHYYSFAQYEHLFYLKYFNTQFLIGLTVKI